MKSRNTVAVGILGAFLAGPLVRAECSFKMAGELPIMMDGNNPLVEGEINGQPMRALIDTGAELSILWAEAASQYGLRPIQIDGLKIVGVGGVQTGMAVTLRELKLGKARQRKLRIAVASGAAYQPGSAALLLGQDLLSQYDVEYDLRNKVVRLFETEGCETADLAYWAEGAYEVVPLRPRTENLRGIHLAVLLNGKPVRALLDTGAYTTVVTLAAARRAGLQPGSAGVKQAGVSAGVGSRKRDSWIGSFSTFQIGDQVIKNARIRMADLFGGTREAPTGSRIAMRGGSEPEMLLGADFFQAHRVLVSYRQNKAYFTYNGGPVFQIEGPLLEQAEPEKR